MDLDKLKLFIVVLGICFLGGLIALLPLRKWSISLERWFNRLPKTVQNVISYIFFMIVIIIILYAWSQPARPIE